jgi:hypothetical protein
MQKLNRRRVLASLGAMGGSAWLTGCGRQLPADSEASAPQSVEVARTTEAVEPVPSAKAAVEQLAVASRDWTYRPLDPEAVGQLAYEIYPKGSCMYSVFGSVMMQLADKVGEPFRSFPIDMMRYGAYGRGRLGIGVWRGQRLCGIDRSVPQRRGHPKRAGRHDRGRLLVVRIHARAELFGRTGPLWTSTSSPTCPDRCSVMCPVAGGARRRGATWSVRSDENVADGFPPRGR